MNRDRHVSNGISHTHLCNAFLISGSSRTIAHWPVTCASFSPNNGHPYRQPGGCHLGSGFVQQWLLCLPRWRKQIEIVVRRDRFGIRTRAITIYLISLLQFNMPIDTGYASSPCPSPTFRRLLLLSPRYHRLGKCFRRASRSSPPK